MLQPAVLTFPTNCSKFEVWVGVRMREPSVCVPSISPAKEELVPGREPWDRQHQQHLFLPMEAFSLLRDVNLLPPHPRENSVS